MSQVRQAAPAVTNVRYYPNTNRHNKPTTSKVKRAVFYYGYGPKTQNPDKLPRGEWYSQQGAERHGDVVAWAVGNAIHHKYTYTLVLSLRDGLMRPEDFIAAMAGASQEIFPDWRLIIHTDTAHDHAHVMAFRDTTLSKQAFNAWRKKAGQLLQTAEQKRLQEAEQGITQAEGHKRPFSRSQTPHLEDELEL